MHKNMFKLAFAFGDNTQEGLCSEEEEVDMVIFRLATCERAETAPVAGLGSSGLPSPSVQIRIKLSEFHFLSFGI